ncbi:MAG TPA: cytochrome b/b6 domain-containing protein [Methylotenera sp.]|nr:cytochrome b/b6 domain-containing protein [Methylotenera sp.]HPH05369.1 cytochrome b/b6 domain-containing protein [Methylotenera sp.]HPN01295.1 cytochrome b/b6 domain-containing protein [Methylotenera sp.]
MQTVTYHRQKVYDPVLRVIHLWNGLAIVFLMVTIWLSELFEKGVGEETLWHVHIYVGYALVVGIVSRLVWGVVGPKHARLSDMWHPAVWWNAVRHFNLQAKPRFGHNTLASGAYIAVYLMLVVMAVTGLGLAAVEHGMGPFNTWFGDAPWLKDLFEEPHELIYYALMGFVLVHIAALIWHENKDKTPLAQSMVTGYQYEVEENHSTSIYTPEGESNA